MKVHVGSILIGATIGVVLMLLMSTLHTDSLMSHLRRSSKGKQHFQKLVEEAHKIVHAKSLGHTVTSTTGNLSNNNLNVSEGIQTQISAKKGSKASIQLVEESETELHSRPNHEHIDKLRDTTFHKDNRHDWQEQAFSKPYIDAERTKPCSNNEEATKLNSEAVALVRSIIDDAAKCAPKPDFNLAKKMFSEATKLAPTCLSPRLNLVIIRAAELCNYEKRSTLLDETELGQIRYELRQMTDGELVSEKSASLYFWAGVIEELSNNQSSASATTYYSQASKLDSTLKAQHVHRTRMRGPFEVLRPVWREVDYHYRKGLVQLLFYYDFAPAMGAYTKITYADTQRFLRDWYIKLDSALPPFAWAVVSRMYRIAFDGTFDLGKGLYKGAATFESNGDCVNSWYNIRIAELVSRLSGIAVKPTYGYTAGYIAGDVLKPHTDRKACEFTLTTLIESYPHPSYCPLYAQKTPWKIDRNWVGRFEDTTIKYDEAFNLHPELNQWLILRGRAVPHYRPPLANGATCTTFLSHFVPEGEAEQ